MPSTMPFPRRALPRMALVRQHLPAEHIPDPAADLHRNLAAFLQSHPLRRGARVAITAGSRGIGALVELVRGVATAIRDAGGDPFVVPAMGSHGGATAEGQTEILRRLGLAGDAAGAPIRSTMETHDLGPAANGAHAHIDSLAAEADGIVVLARVEIHPESAAGLASGLLKMATIGLGKQIGAHQAHSHKLWDSVRAVPRLQLAKAPILCGIAVVETAYRRPCDIEVIPPAYDAWLETDQRLLKTAQSHVAKIPFDSLDLLIVDEIGKTVSGAGMDPNVIGTWRARPSEPRHPDYRRIAALSLTYGSLGNGLGIGMADFTTRRFLDAYDPAVSYVNLLTASEPGGNTAEGPVPLALPNDREAAEVALFSSLAGPQPRVCRIRNTASLAEFWASEALLDEVRRNSKLEIIADPAPLPFDPQDNLPPWTH